MKIQEKDLYHGTALTQLVEHESFKALNRASEKYGHYLVNTDREVFVKYRKDSRSPWQFIFQPDELLALSRAMKHKNRVFLCLVCGSITICALDEDEFATVLNLKDARDFQQWIRVLVPPRSSCHVSGHNGELK